MEPPAEPAMAPGMERRGFGPTGAQVAVIGQGTWQLRDPDGAAEALRAGLDLGLDHIDTAELYTGSEQVVREALQGRDRDAVWLVSKVLPRNASFEGVLRACDASLERLGTDHVDVYLLHWWSDRHPIEDTMRAMGELLDTGRTRFVGVSNLDVPELEAAQEALGRKHRIVCDQVLYHLGQRDVEHELLPYCAEKGVAMVAYSPFGGSPGHGFPRPGSKQHEALARVGEAHGGRSPRQVALRFLTRNPAVFAIPKAEQVPHVRENAGGQGWDLTEEGVRAIEDAFPLPKPRRRGSGLPML